jgi:uncharacterized peroxidase-related enzyme
LSHTADLRAEAPQNHVDVLTSNDPSPALTPAQVALLSYVEKLTLTPAACRRQDVERLREAGASDEEIHATVQVAAYFNYINRVADALGVDLEPWMDESPE